MSKRSAANSADALDGEGDQEAISDGVPPARINSKRHRVALACVICRQRKIKCDGRKPCKTCTDAKRPARCEYPSITPLRDDEYVRNLEERVRLLSGQVEQEQNHRSLDTNLASDNFPSSLFDFEAELPGIAKNSRRASDSIRFGTSLEPQLQRRNSANDHISSPPPEPVHPPYRESSSIATSEGHYLTTLASPSASNRNADSGDSSARTLLHSVEAAMQQLPSRPGVQSRSYYSHPSFRASSPDSKPLQLPFVWQQSKADLYSLPQRHISDALVNVYRALNYPIFKVLHWPTFMSRYNNTFTAGEQDPIWLGMLNQIYAIACQIGGRDIVGDDEFEAGHKFHQRALALGYPVALCTESLEGLQYLLLMGQYLLSTSQPTLCRNVVGHAVRSAQAQGLHTCHGGLDEHSLRVEMRRRAWAGVIILDATSSAVLGLSPLLCPEGLPHTLPSGAEDEDTGRQDRNTLAISARSSSLFMRETTKLLAVQIQVLATLYNIISTSSLRWPDVPSILASARQLDRWRSALPDVLRTGPSGVTARAGRAELELQSHVLHARYLNLKLLVHRPMLFHICQRASTNDLLGDAPSHLDTDIARGSMVHCCSAALELLEHVTDSWEQGRRVGGAWWFHLYYFHSACLVLLAGLIVEVIASAKSISCLPDVARVVRGVRSAEVYLSMDPSESRSILPRLPKGPARSTARNCCRIIGSLTAHILSSAPHLQSPASYVEYPTIRDSTRDTQGHGSQSINFHSNIAEASASDTADLYQAFLDLFPDVPTLPNFETHRVQEIAGRSLVNPADLQYAGTGFDEYMNPPATAPFSTIWSIGDFPRAGSAPQPLSTFNVAFDTLYSDSGSGPDASASAIHAGQVHARQSPQDLGIFENYVVS